MRFMRLADRMIDASARMNGRTAAKCLNERCFATRGTILSARVAIRSGGSTPPLGDLEARRRYALEMRPCFSMRERSCARVSRVERKEGAASFHHAFPDFSDVNLRSPAPPTRVRAEGLPVACPSGSEIPEILVLCPACRAGRRGRQSPQLAVCSHHCRSPSARSDRMCISEPVGIQAFGCRA